MGRKKYFAFYQLPVVLQPEFQITLKNKYSLLKFSFYLNKNLFDQLFSMKICF